MGTATLATEEEKTVFLPVIDRTSTLGRLVDSLVTDLSKENDPEKFLRRLDRLNPTIVEYINSDNTLHDWILERLTVVRMGSSAETQTKFNRWLEKFQYETVEHNDNLENERVFICSVANLSQQVPYDASKVQLLDKILNEDACLDNLNELKEILVNATEVAKKIGRDDIAEEISSIMERHNIH